jgi:hypothetical protein
MEMATDFPSTFEENSSIKLVGYDLTANAAKRCDSGRATRDRCYGFGKKFCQKFLKKKLAFLTQIKAKSCKNLILTLVFEANVNFSIVIITSGDQMSL